MNSNGYRKLLSNAPGSRAIDPIVPASALHSKIIDDR
jgi:hypothetical protein